MYQEYQNEIARLRKENNQMLYAREARERDFENIIFENQTLYNKLENLENVFIGQPSRKNTNEGGRLSQEYAQSTLLVENEELKRKIEMLEMERMELKAAL